MGFNRNTPATPTIEVEISSVAGPEQRADTGYPKFASVTHDNDFANSALESVWDGTRSNAAAWQLLAGLSYPPIQANSYLSRLAAYNPNGVYCYQKALTQVANEDPVKGGIWTTNPTLLTFMRDGNPNVFPEEWYVHHSSGSTWQYRLRNSLTTSQPRWLLAFNNEDLFDTVYAPVLDRLVADFALVLPGAAPGVFIDAFPSNRNQWLDSTLNPNLTGWDAFPTDEAWYDGCVTLCRRIKARYPTMRIMVNWDSNVDEVTGDKVLEVVDALLFEQQYSRVLDRQRLSLGYKAAKCGKGVIYSGGVEKVSAPTIDELSFTDSANTGRRYWCQFLLTMGPRTYWSGRWRPTNAPTTEGLANIDTVKRYYGQPIEDMVEVKQNLWRRRFTGSEVWYNADDEGSLTYKIPVHGCVDEAGALVTEITLAPGEGQYVFKQTQKVTGHTNGAYRKHLPEPARGRVYEPVSKQLDVLAGSIGIGVGKSGGNLLKGADFTSSTYLGLENSTTVAADGTFCGIDMYRIENNSAQPKVRPVFVTPGGVQNQYLHVFFYAQQLSTAVSGLVVYAGANYGEVILRPGWPKLYHIVGQLTDAAFAGGGPITDSLIVQTFESGARGAFRMGGFRCVLSTSATDDELVAEHLITKGKTVTRGAGIGLGLPVYAMELSGYSQVDASRAKIDILNSTAVVGISSDSGTTGNRPTPAAAAVGYQYWDTTLGKPIWWNGTVWKDATGATV